MVSAGRYLTQALYLIAIILLASLGCLLGPIYSGVWSLVRLILELLTKFFRGWSRVFSMLAATMLGHFLLSKRGHNVFGQGYTVSAVLGYNEHYNYLSKLGQLVSHMLDTIDPGHCYHAAIKAKLL
jgi:hypothetical protein